MADSERLKRELAAEVEPYRRLLDDLVAGRLSADDFQTEYFDRYANDPRLHSHEVFKIVDRFFSDVDSYVDNPAIRDPANGDLGPEELRELAAALLRRAGFDVPEVGAEKGDT